MNNEILKTGIWRQFGATIDYLAETIKACPVELWPATLWDHAEEKPEFSRFWYRAYHTLFWLDLYLTGAEEGFLPPAPFELIEQTEEGPLPQRVYTKDELLTYLTECRKRCKATIEALTDDSLERQCSFSWGECSFFELLIYNLRHVQEHTAQLNLLLGQKVGPTPDYKTQLKNEAL